MSNERTPLVSASSGYGTAPRSPNRAQTWPERRVSRRGGSLEAAAAAEAAALQAVQGNWNGPHTALAYVYAARRRHRLRKRRIQRIALACLFLVIVYFVTVNLASLYDRHCHIDVPTDQRGRFCPPPSWNISQSALDLVPGTKLTPVEHHTLLSSSSPAGTS